MTYNYANPFPILQWFPLYKIIFVVQCIIIVSIIKRPNKGVYGLKWRALCGVQKALRIWVTFSVLCATMLCSVMLDDRKLCEIHSAHVYAASAKLWRILAKVHILCFCVCTSGY